MTTKTALVTGASRGLGAALAEELAPDYHVIAVARTTGGLEDLDDRIRLRDGTATLAPMDITTDAAMQQLCRAIHDRWGKLDLWLHTAIHASPLTPVPHMEASDWARSVETNVLATGRLITYVAPLLGDKGTAVFFEDTTPQGRPFFGDYGATKAAQTELARNWQTETRRLGPKVVIARPAPMPTAVRARFFPGENKTLLASPADEAKRIIKAL